MNDYSKGFRHITLFGESDDQKQDLNNILKEKGYNYEENDSGVMVLVKEKIGTNKHVQKELKTFMHRVTDEEAKEFEKLIHTRFRRHLEGIIPYAKDRAIELLRDPKLIEIEKVDDEDYEGY